MYDVAEPGTTGPVADLFASVPQWRAMVDSTLLGGPGLITVDDERAPRVGVLFFGGAVIYAGDPDAPDADAIVRRFPVQPLILGYDPRWNEAVARVFGEAVTRSTRYLLDPETIDPGVLRAAGAFEPPATASSGAEVRRFDPERFPELATALGWEHQLHHYANPPDFADRSGCVLGVENDAVVAGASSFVDAPTVVECQVTVAPAHRRRGWGALVAARYVGDRLDRGKRVPWDAANEASVLLAQRIGYGDVAEYEVLSVLP